MLLMIIKLLHTNQIGINKIATCLFLHILIRLEIRSFEGALFIPFILMSVYIQKSFRSLYLRCYILLFYFVAAAGCGVVWCFGCWLFLGGFRVGWGGIIPPFIPNTYLKSHFLPCFYQFQTARRLYPF